VDPEHSAIWQCLAGERLAGVARLILTASGGPFLDRSEEHTSELQSRGHLVCRLLLEKKARTTRQWSRGGMPCRRRGRSALPCGTKTIARSSLSRRGSRRSAYAVTPPAGQRNSCWHTS